MEEHTEKDKIKNQGAPKTFLYPWLVLSTIMNIAGIGSICDGVVKWYGLFGRFIDWYQSYVRDPLQAFLGVIWPDFIVQLPPWFADYSVIVGTYVTSFLLWGVSGEKNSPSMGAIYKTVFTLPKFFWIMIKDFAGGKPKIRQMVLVFLVIFFMYFFVFFFIYIFPLIHILGGIFFVLAVGEWPQGSHRRLNYYLLCTVSAVFILVIVNFQIRDLCEGATTPSKVCRYFD